MGSSPASQRVWQNPFTGLLCFPHTSDKINPALKRKVKNMYVKAVCKPQIQTMSEGCWEMSDKEAGSRGRGEEPA